MGALKDIRSCQILALNRNGSCLSETYVKARTKYLWKCKENHTWSAADPEGCLRRVDAFLGVGNV